MCKIEPIKFYKVATIDKKKWYICSSDCYLRYLTEVLKIDVRYINIEVKKAEIKDSKYTKEQIEEFPDY